MTVTPINTQFAEPSPSIRAYSHPSTASENQPESPRSKDRSLPMNSLRLTSGTRTPLPEGVNNLWKILMVRSYESRRSASDGTPQPQPEQAPERTTPVLSRAPQLKRTPSSFSLVLPPVELLTRAESNPFVPTINNFSFGQNIPLKTLTTFK